MEPVIIRDEPIPHRCRNANCYHAGSSSGKMLCATCRSRKARQQDPIKSLWWNLRWSAKRRGIPFDLELEAFRGWFFENNLDVSTIGSNQHKEGLSIDRQNDDPEKGYHGYRIGNIKPMMLGANARKYQRYKHHKKNGKVEEGVNVENYEYIPPYEGEDFF